MHLDITTRDYKTLKYLLNAFLPGTTVWAFGSRVKFTSKPESDLDLVAFIQPGQESSLADLRDAFAESDLLFKVDILDWGVIPDSFKKNIEKEYVVVQDEKEQIPSNWRVYKLEEIAKVQTGPFGSQLHQKDYTIEGTPIITVEHLGENKILRNNLPRISDADKERLNKYTLKEGDIVFSRVGSVDRRAFVTGQEDGWLFSGRCLRVRTTAKEVNSKYLSYLFGLEDFKSKIRSIAVGATMPSLNTSIMNNIEVSIPENIGSQIQIASILSSLDEKIEINQQMNQTLENMAQAIFKEWFVNFNFPGFDGELIHRLPKGWSKGKIEDLFVLQRGFDLPAITRTVGNYPVMASNGITTYHDEFKIEGPGVTTGRSGVLGKVFYTNERFWPLNTSLFVKEFKRATPLFAYYTLLGLNLTQLNGGSAVPTLNRNDVHGIDCLIPDKTLIEKFEDTAFRLFNKKRENEKQIKSLSEIRDSLLPRLMNGKIKIND